MVIESETLHDEEAEEKHLGRLRNSWEKLDKLLLVFGCLVNLGDGVEVYLPGSLNHY